MHKKELRKLGKTDLLTIIYEQQKEIESLKVNITDLENKLSDKTINLKEAGSIAEASLKINKIFEAAQEAANQYLSSIKAVNKLESEEIRQETITNEEKFRDTSEQNGVNINKEKKQKEFNEQTENTFENEIEKENCNEKTDVNLDKINDTNEKESQISEKGNQNNFLIPSHMSLAIIKPKLVKRLLMFFAKIAKMVLVFFVKVKNVFKSVFKKIIILLKLIAYSVLVVLIYLKAFVRYIARAIVWIFKNTFKIIVLILKKIWYFLKKIFIRCKSFRMMKIIQKIQSIFSVILERLKIKKLILTIKSGFIKIVQKIKILCNNLVDKLKFKKHKLKKEATDKRTLKLKKLKKCKFVKSDGIDSNRIIFSIEELERELTKIKKRKSRLNFARTFFFACLVIIAIAIITATSFFKVLQVNGSSMEPNLQNGELLITSKFFEYKKGDMIAFYYNDKVLIKRIIATEGEIVNIDDDGTVYVNNEKLEEDYVKELDYGKCNITFPYIVPENSVFILGDNRKVSLDSRSSSIGCILRDNIIGKIKFRLNPFKIF